jgi:Ni/Co efflux regulator RcnB
VTRNNTKSPLRFILIGIALSLMAGGVSADKPSWAGGGKSKEGKERHEDKERSDLGRDDNRHGGALVISFSSDDRRIISEYYGSQARKGNCPPGLAKKHNGCQPPGQAKKWQKGHPLPADITYYELPRELRVRLPVAPPNYRYVQIAGDILMIAVGTGMVVDAIEDILR